MKIVAVLNTALEGAVLADEDAGGVVRLWTLSSPFRDGRTMRALRRFFPNAETHGEDLLRLGGFRALLEAHEPLVEAKMTSSSPSVERLFRYDVPESLATLKHFS